MINIILMAGRGQRFKDKGYVNPKALIPVKKKMMFEHSLSNCSNPERYIFVVNKQIFNHNKFKNYLKNFKNNYEVVVLNRTTNGQATSLYKSLNNVRNEDKIFVSSCDVSFQSIKNLDDSKNTIFAIKANNFHFKNSKYFGWTYMNEKEIKVSCKSIPEVNKKLSIIIGSFYFSKAENFKLAYEKMVKENFTTSGEFYLDNIFNFDPIKKNSIIRFVDGYKSFGTPEEIILN